MKFVSKPTVELIDSMGNDMSVVRAARVSTVGQNEPETDAPGLINYLIKHKHGSPFEHTALTFYVSAPLFVVAQMLRHRSGVSFNQASGRYKEMEPVFYVPSDDRPLVNVGGSARPKFEHGDSHLPVVTTGGLVRTAKKGWETYKFLLDEGVGNEVARMVLPQNLMTELYVTYNVRSLLHFLSLRTSDSGSHPQYEIEQVARQFELALNDKFPVVFEKWNINGRESV